MKRRQALKVIGGAASAAGVLSALPLAAQAALPESSRRLRIAVVGLGDYARVAMQRLVRAQRAALAGFVTGDRAKATEIQGHVKAVLAPYKYPRDVRFEPSLPRNTSGKLQHFKLRRMAESGAGSEESS